MAKHRHKRETNARIVLRDLSVIVPRPALVAAPAAGLVTLTAVGLGMAGQAPAESRDLLAGTSAYGDLGVVADREPIVTRSQSRSTKTQGEGRQAVPAGSGPAQDRAERRASQAQEQRKQAAEASQQALAATRRAVAGADTQLWTTTELNLWSAPGADAVQVGVLDSGEQVLVTGRSQDGREEIVLDGRSRWVTAGYLDDEKPVPGVGGACTNGTSVPSNLDPDVAKVHQAVCAAFPQIASYGTWRSDGEHGQGRAVDIMVSGELGWQVAEFVRANHVALGVEYLIYSQRIWSVERGGEGWRAMSDRGSATANHYDHVHVTVY